MTFKETFGNTVKFVKLVRKDQKGIVWILFGGSFISSLVPFISLLYSAKILNLVSSGKRKECIPVIVVMLILNLVLGLISRGCAQVLEVLKKASYETVERKTAYRAFTMDYEELERPKTLDAIRRVKQGEQTGGGVGNQISNLNILAGEIWTIVFSFLFVIQLFRKIRFERNGFLTSSKALFFMLVLYIGVVALTAWFAKTANNKCNKMRKNNEHNNSVANYVLSLSSDYKNGKDIRLFHMQNLILHCYEFYYDKYASMYLIWGRLNGMVGGEMIFLSQIPALISYGFVIAQARNHIIGTGDILLYAGAINRLTQAVQQVMVTYHSFAYRMDYLKTYERFIEQTELKEDGTVSIKELPEHIEFEFQNVNFCYPETENQVLHDVNMILRKGEKIAIVGQNGAGKTTFIKLLCRFYEPTSGRILLNGRDIRVYKREEYQALFSAVFQDFKLFSFPVGENIAAGSKIEEERVWKALEAVGMKETVERMPKKLNTRLYRQNGEGIEISGGQAQKLAIARALYKNAPVVVLDEPASALDPFSEAEIYEKFNEFVADKMAVYISHRMSSCKFCERIVVLEHGTIAEEGKHEELLRQNGLYAKLYHTQAQYYI